MKTLLKIPVTLAVIASFLLTLAPPARPCGPMELVPAFENYRSPDYPYNGFADGRLGIVSPEFPRIVLFAAYRYMNGNTFSAYEREALVEAWSEFFSRSNAGREDVSNAIKAWIAERASVIGEEENPPEIYSEKPYSDFTYDFFPNCSKDAFVVARDTLSDRAASRGSTDRWVLEWISGQDTVFRNCADSKASPAPVTASMPEWLQKDRAYQIAAAEFYSLSYEKAKDRFAAIANDPDSPWQEVAEYLVPRTLVRQASLGRNKAQSRVLYAEAEQSLENIYAGGGRYADAAEKLMGLVKYRLHPEQRVQELAQNLSYYGGDNLKQDLIDYTWLLAKFEAQALQAEEKRKKEEFERSPEGRAQARREAEAAGNSNAAADWVDSLSNTNSDDGLASIYVYNDDFSESWTVSIDPEGSDEDAYAAVEAVAGPLSEKMRERIREARQIAYQNRFDEREEEYEGYCQCDEETSVDILPAFLIANDLTEWLFTFQIEGEAAYDRSLLKFRQTNSDAWLVAALTKANSGSREIGPLLESARSIPVTSPAFPTAAYHRARLLIDLGRTAEAKAALDSVLETSVDIPFSARNEMARLRMGLSDSLDDFLRYALRRPYALGWGNEFLTVDEMIAREKSYYDPEYYEQSRDEYERMVEEQFAYARAIETELMLDTDSIEIINYHFPFELLLKTQISRVIPEYLRGRLALVIWTRAVMLGEWKVADLMAPEALAHHPEIASELNAYITAGSTEQKKSAALFVMLKNERVSPYLASGFGTATEGLSYASRWWCEPYEQIWDERKQEMVAVSVKDRPSFVTEPQSKAAFSDMKKLKEMGGAPRFLAERVLEWAAVSPRDPRVPESLYIAWEANGWDKYGCEGEPTARERLKNVLVTKYRTTPWAQKALAEEN